MEDLSVVMALLLLLFGVVFLTDIARYQWMLMLMLVLGLVMNLNIMLCGFLRKKPILSGVTGLIALALLGFLIYLGLHRI